MYKSTSSNMQGRASRIRARDLPSGGLTQDQLLAAVERRKSLILEHEELSRRVSEIRTILNVKRGVKHKEIKGDTRRRPEFAEWIRHAERITALVDEISSLPDVKTVTMAEMIVSILERRHPAVYADCKVAALTRIQQECVLVVEKEAAE